MIAVFSGTGNSLYAATLLSSRLGDRIVTYSPDGALPQPADGRIVWVFPVYSWGVPPVVEQWIERTSCTHLDHYCVLTCGDDAGLTAGQWRRLIERRGGRACSVFSVIMPNVYVLMKGFDVDSESVATLKLSRVPARIEDIAQHIAAGEEGIDDVTRGSFAWIKSKVIYPWFKRYAMSPKPFHATEACTGCGSCARHCPLHNITMVDGRPRWGDRCALCLRCYHQCGSHAVAYGKATEGKGRYLCPTPPTGRAGARS